MHLKGHVHHANQDFRSPLCPSSLPGSAALFSGGRFPSADPLAPSIFKDLAIAASASPSSRFENMTSAKEFRNLERTRFIEYCESSQRAMTFSVVLYSSFVGKLISPAVLLAVPYFFAMACTMSSAAM